MAKKANKANANANASKANANEMQNLLAIGAITSVEAEQAEELTDEQKAIVEVVSEINNALSITPNEAEAEAEAEMTDEEKNEIIRNTTKNQLDECAKRVQKEVNSLNGALKALYKEEVYKNLFDALDCKSYDEVRAKVMSAIAYASEDKDNKFIAVTLKPIARFNNTTFYKVQKLNWFVAISQATYRLARGLQREQNVIADSYYIKSENENLFNEVEESVTIAEIEMQIKADKYTKALARVNKLKLEF